MDKESVLTIIADFNAEMEALGTRPSKVILYGSYARGDWHEWSDIDLVVVSPDFEGMGYWDRIEVLTEAIYRVRQPIEAVAMDPDQWDRGDSMLAQIAREGELVYSD